ncbi:hypothetical protein Tco_0047181 [Tanacetum coccineum]
MSRMDDDLFTCEVKISGLANIPCDLNEEDDLEQQMTHGSGDDMEYDPTNARGDDEVELTNEESSNSNNEEEFAEIFRIDTNGFKTYDDYKDDWIYKWDKDIPWVHEKPLTNNGVWKEPTPVEHCCEPFLFKKDIQNGQPIAGNMMDIVTEGTFLELT